jgi:GntR family transcriptional regulator, trigonelline degradation regulator
MTAENNDDTLRLVRKPVLLRQLAAETLRDAIIAGVFSPGMRLVEADLAQRLGVSRASTREALCQLEAEKLLTLTPNRGPVVTTLTWQEAQGIYDIRGLLESDAAYRFVPLASKEQITRMHRSLKEFERAISKNDVRQLISTTAKFYSPIIENCGNPITAEVLRGLMARISFLRARSMSQVGRPPHSLAEMSAILDAIEHQDAAAAHQASLIHVQRAAAAARTIFDSAIPSLKQAV